MSVRLFQRRNLWCPTFLGWIVLLLLFGAPFLLWWFKGEAYFSLTERQPATVLIVEGWIGVEGVQAAKQEFDHGGYDTIVTVGGLSTKDWGPQRWSFAF